MSLCPPPEVIQTEIFTRLPEHFRNKRNNSWAEINKGGQKVDCFLEGPCFDKDGNLYVTDVPFGRIFRISPDGGWTLVAEYEGWPCGIKILMDGRMYATDHKLGLVNIEPTDGSVTVIVDKFRTEGLKGVNDLTVASNGDLYFTDQGQTGLQDPTGRVFRLKPSGTLELILATVPSPNGLVLNASETQLYVAVTRANAIWRLPLTPDGSVTKVGMWIQLSGGLAGPDGLALDEEGGLIVAHPGMAVWRFDALGRPTHSIEPTPSRFTTNIAFGGEDNRWLYITESDSGTVLRARMPVAGRQLLPTS